MPGRTYLVTLTSPEIADYAQHTIPQFHAYAEQHRYILAHHHIEGALPRHIVWKKLEILADLAASLPRQSQILWLDADCLITNPALPLTSVLPPREWEHIAIFASMDLNGLNAGVVYFRPHSRIADALNLAHDRLDLENHPYREQQALRETLEKQPELWHLLPKHVFNSYPDDWQPGDYICHYAGQPNKAEKIRLHIATGRP